MARLKDLHDLIEASGGLPKGRIRSLIMEGRKVGLFTSEGKGRRPRIVGRDAAHGLLFVLHGDDVVRSVEAVQALRDLPLWTVQMDMGGGDWCGPVRGAEFYATAPADDLPPVLHKLALAETLGAALSALFDDSDGTLASHRFNDGDELEILRIRDACRVDLLLCDYGSEAEPSTMRWLLRFMRPADERAIMGGTIENRRTIRGPMLDDLAALVEGRR